MALFLPPGRLILVGNLSLDMDCPYKGTDFNFDFLKYIGEFQDVAIDGLGFFLVESPEGIRRTRDGHNFRDLGGKLMTVDGFQVLDLAGNPISIPQGLIAIIDDGSIYVDGQLSSQLAVDLFVNPQVELIQDISNTFEVTGSPNGTYMGRVHQLYLVMTPVNPALFMNKIEDLTRAFEAAKQLVQVQEELLVRMIATLGWF